MPYPSFLVPTVSLTFHPAPGHTLLQTTLTTLSIDQPYMCKMCNACAPPPSHLPPSPPSASCRHLCPSPTPHCEQEDARFWLAECKGNLPEGDVMLLNVSQCTVISILLLHPTVSSRRLAFCQHPHCEWTEEKRACCLP